MHTGTHSCLGRSCLSASSQSIVFFGLMKAQQIFAVSVALQCQELNNQNQLYYARCNSITPRTWTCCAKQIVWPLLLTPVCCSLCRTVSREDEDCSDWSESVWSGGVQGAEEGRPHHRRSLHHPRQGWQSRPTGWEPYLNLCWPLTPQF